MKSLYPVYMNIQGRVCVVIGGGMVGERRTKGLLESGADILVISPEVTEALEKLAEDSFIRILKESYKSDHLTGAFLAFAATNSTEVNLRVLDDARQKGVLCSSAEMYQGSDYVVPATIRRGELCISIATSCGLPGLSSQIAADISLQYGPEYGPLVDLMCRLRSELITSIWSPVKRRKALDMLMGIADQLRARILDGEDPEPFARSILEEYLSLNSAGS